MCNDCGRNFTTEAGLAWSLPVHPARLGAHLEALVSAQPVINHLLLCHSCGKGEKAYIKRLPRELIDLIIEHYLTPIREQRFREWDRDFACYEGRCKVRDHFSKAEWYSFLSQVWEDGSNAGVTEDNEHEMAEEIAENTGEDFDVHQTRVSDWESRLVQKSHQYVQTTAGAVPKKGKSTSAFEVYDEVLKRGFGLGAFLSNQRLPSWLSTVLDLKDHAQEDVRNTTIAFLTLPSTFMCDDGSNLMCNVDSNPDYADLTSHMSMAVDLKSLRVSELKKKRFARALKILDLQPYVHPVQLLPHKEKLKRGENEMLPSKACRGDFAEDKKVAVKGSIDANVKKLEKAKWPQLLYLVSTSYKMFV